MPGSSISVSTPPLSRRQGVSEGPFLASGGSTVFFPGEINNAVGAINFISANLIGPVTGVAGSGSLATVGFTALALGISPVTITGGSVIDSNLVHLPFQTVNGSVTVQQVTQVPVPGTWLLMVTGLVGLGAYRRLGR